MKILHFKPWKYRTMKYGNAHFKVRYKEYRI